MLEWAEHPLLERLSDEEMVSMEPADLLAYHRTYHEAISRAETDPFRYGYELPSWKHSWDMWKEYRTLLLLGANRSSKTEFGAKTVVKAALSNPNSLIYCWSQNEETSIIVQQAAIYRYIPPELKTKSQSDIQYISYKAQTGFSERSVIFANGSRIIFKLYSQWQQNQTILEGMELGSRNPTWLNVGSWCDEYLGGMDLLDRLYLRLATRNALLLLTFTPKDGLTETVNNYLKEAKTVNSSEAPLMQELHGMPMTVPTIQINEKKRTCVSYFHTINNPWGGYEGVVEMCRSKNDYRYTLTAAYGVPTKSYTTKFPKFSVDTNVVPAKTMNEWVNGKDAKVTRYQIIDPAGKKNWFVAWIAVDAAGTYFVFREWPGVDIGEWAQQGKNGKWVPGEGAKGLGYGLKDYIELSYREEGNECVNGTWTGGEDIFVRLIDPRLGAAKYQGADGESSIMQDLEDLDFIVIPAPGSDIEDGIQKINDLLAYDTSKPIEGTNRPKLYVSDACQNIIMAFAEYTGEDGLKEAWKDCLDPIRYAATYELEYIDPKMSIVTATSGGY